MILKLLLLNEQNGMQTWEAQLGKMPIPSEERTPLVDFLTRLLQAGADTFNTTPTVWVEATHLHLESGTRLLAPNAAKWAPQIGMGIHPDGELPRLWTEEDFAEAPWDHKPPVFNNQVWEISRASGHESAITAMAGRGALSLLLLNGSAADFKAQMHETLGPLVKERAFRMYPFFFPLLTGESADAARVHGWLGNASIYVREVFEEGTLIVLSTVPLQQSFAKLKGEVTGPAEWQFDLRLRVGS